ARQQAERARARAQAQTPLPTPVTANDAAWHFGMTPDQAQRLSRRQLRVLSEAVAEDERKRAAGQDIKQPTLGYQNEMRKRAGLPALVYNAPRQIQVAPGVMITPTDANKAVAPYFQPSTGRLPYLGGPSREQTEIQQMLHSPQARAIGIIADEQART